MKLVYGTINTTGGLFIKLKVTIILSFYCNTSLPSQNFPTASRLSPGRSDIHQGAGQLLSSIKLICHCGKKTNEDKSLRIRPMSKVT